MPVIENHGIEEAIGEVIELVLEQARAPGDACGDGAPRRRRASARSTRGRRSARRSRPRGGSGGRSRTAPRRRPRPACARPLEDFSIDGRIVIGLDDGPLAAGQRIGAGGESVDLALDPLEGRGVVARGGNGAMSMIAVGEPGSLRSLPRDVHAQDRGRPARARPASTC